MHAWYYSRYFRSRTGRPPEFRAGLQTHLESFSLLTLPADAHTWSVTVYILAGDQAQKKLHDLDRWTALVSRCPQHAHLIDATPITGLISLGGILDRSRRFVADGTPVATGVVAIGDAWACTNPSLGRGIAMGLMHAAGTRVVTREHLADPVALAHAHHAMTEQHLAPWYRNTLDLDRARVARIRAAIEGRPAPEPTDPAAQVRNALPVAMRYDPDVYRALVEMSSMLALPQEVLARPGLAGKILDAARGQEAAMPPGPSRAEALQILA